MWLEHGVNLRIRLVPGDGAWCPWAVVKLGIRLVPRKVVRVMVDPRVNTWRLGSTTWRLGRLTEPVRISSRSLNRNSLAVRRMILGSVEDETTSACPPHWWMWLYIWMCSRNLSWVKRTARVKSFVCHV